MAYFVHLESVMLESWSQQVSAEFSAESAWTRLTFLRTAYNC